MLILVMALHVKKKGGEATLTAARGLETQNVLCCVRTDNMNKENEKGTRYSYMSNKNSSIHRIWQHAPQALEIRPGLNYKSKS